MMMEWVGYLLFFGVVFLIAWGYLRNHIISVRDPRKDKSDYYCTEDDVQLSPSVSIGRRPRQGIEQMTGKGRLFLIVLFSAAAFVQPSHAAKIKGFRTPYSPLAPYAIVIDGRIEKYDNVAFERIARTMTDGKVVLFLESPGGNLVSALLIGEFIHDRDYITVVNKSNPHWGETCNGGKCINECASACAAIWLAGKQRFLQTGVFLGFHASSLDGQPSYDGDQVLREYYRMVGIRSETINVLLSYSPDSIMWMTRELAAALGIASEVWKEKQGPGVDPEEKPFWKYDPVARLSEPKITEPDSTFERLFGKPRPVTIAPADGLPGPKITDYPTKPPPKPEPKITEPDSTFKRRFGEPDRTGGLPQRDWSANPPPTKPPPPKNTEYLTTPVCLASLDEPKAPGCSIGRDDK
jgi:hypothetical protein